MPQKYRKPPPVTTRGVAHSLAARSNQPGASFFASSTSQLTEVEDNRPRTTTQFEIAQAVQAKMQTKPAVSKAPIQMVTDINHDTKNFDTGDPKTSFNVGIGMQAWLDPLDPVVGSATSPNSTWLLGDFTRTFTPPLQQTHLLNHDLGGFGVYENLYPMTAAANKNHYNKVESKVKKALYRADANRQNPGNTPTEEGNGVYYKVQVEGTHDHLGFKQGTKFNCQAFYIDDVANSPRPNQDKLIVGDTITSMPGKDEKPKGYEESPVLPKWSHRQGSAKLKVSSNVPRRREGEATDKTADSLFTIGRSWEDVRRKNVKVGEHLDTTLKDQMALENELALKQRLQKVGYDDGKTGIIFDLDLSTGQKDCEYTFGYRLGYHAGKDEAFREGYRVGLDAIESKYFNLYHRDAWLHDDFKLGFDQGVEDLAIALDADFDTTYQDPPALQNEETQLQILQQEAYATAMNGGINANPYSAQSAHYIAYEEGFNSALQDLVSDLDADLDTTYQDPPALDKKRKRRDKD